MPKYETLYYKSKKRATHQKKIYSGKGYKTTLVRKSYDRPRGQRGRTATYHFSKRRKKG